MQRRLRHEDGGTGEMPPLKERVTVKKVVRETEETERRQDPEDAREGEGGPQSDD